MSKFELELKRATRVHKRRYLAWKPRPRVKREVEEKPPEEEKPEIAPPKKEEKPIEEVKPPEEKPVEEKPPEEEARN